MTNFCPNFTLSIITKKPELTFDDYQKAYVEGFSAQVDSLKITNSFKGYLNDGDILSWLLEQESKYYGLSLVGVSKLFLIKEKQLIIIITLQGERGPDEEFMINQRIFNRIIDSITFSKK